VLAFIPLVMSHHRRTSKRYAGFTILIIITALELTKPYIRLRGGAWNIRLLHIHLAFAIPSFGLLLLCFVLIWRRQRKAQGQKRDVVPIPRVLSYACIGTYAIACCLGMALFYGH
jgi:hypothetical protein